MRWYIKPPFDGIFTQQYWTKNYWNRTTTVEIIVGGWVVSFFETQCIYSGLSNKSSAVAEMGDVWPQWTWAEKWGGYATFLEGSWVLI